MMTEEQAREKWCPFARTATAAGGGSFNRLYDKKDAAPNPTVCRCIASSCMAWRLGEKPHWGGDTLGRTPKESGAVTVRRGYCGLAGESKP